MTRILIINPNSTTSMTDAILASAQAAAPAISIEARTSKEGPPAIQGAADGEAAMGPLLKLVEQASFADAIIIACFDDTGLAAAKARSRVPVIGIGEAAYHAARLMGYRFSVVTTLSVSVPVIEANIKRTGFADICGRVRASEVPVLQIENDPTTSFKAIYQEARVALREDDVSAIVLGCAGMTNLRESLADLDAPIIDGVEAAVHLAHGLANLTKAV